jgi:hypothetical protein
VATKAAEGEASPIEEAAPAEGAVAEGAAAPEEAPAAPEGTVARMEDTVKDTVKNAEERVVDNVTGAVKVCRERLFTRKGCLSHVVRCASCEETRMRRSWQGARGVRETRLLNLVGTRSDSSALRCRVMGQISG